METPNGINGEVNAISEFLAPIFGNFPPELATTRQWLLWVARSCPGKDKADKIPVQPSGYPASTTNPNTWRTLPEVKAAYEAAVACGYIDCKINGEHHRLPVAGVGFVFDGTCDADGNTYVGIDFDNVLGADGKAADNDAKRLFTEYGNRINSYIEKSPRGKGAHIIVKAPPLPSGINYGGVELYSSGRYFTFTGHVVKGRRTINAAPEATHELYGERRAAKEAARGGGRLLAQVTSAAWPFEQPQQGNVIPLHRSGEAWIPRLQATAAAMQAGTAAKAETSELSAGLSRGPYDSLPVEQKSPVVRHAALWLATHTKVFELEANGGNNDQYYRVAQSLARSGVQDAEDIFVEASSKAKDADDDATLRIRFHQLGKTGGNITVGTLFGMAQQCGWKWTDALAAAGMSPTATSAVVSPTGSPAVTVNTPFPDLDKHGRPIKTLKNTIVACQKLGITFANDTFHRRKLVGGHVIERYAGEVSDDACRVLRQVIIDRFGFDPGLENVIEAAATLCLQNSFNPVLDYLDGLTWDGVPRLETWMIDYLGAENTPFIRAVSRIVLIAAVRRAWKPGTKFDQIIVLEGPQGTNKSTSLVIMAGEENFSDQTLLGQDDRRAQELLAGVWMYEASDLAGWRKAETEAIKALASRTHDRARPAYGRHIVSQPRTCVIFATTNNDDYLKDATGNRRFWPVRTTTIDLDALRRDRDQLWAEAAHYETQGASIVLPKSLWATAAAQQEARRASDPWEDVLADVKGTLCTNPASGAPEHRVLTDELFTELGMVVAKDRTDYGAKRIASCMLRLGWTRAGMIRVGTNRKGRGFVKPVAPAGQAQPQAQTQAQAQPQAQTPPAVSAQQAGQPQPGATP
jgi:hypothetical protein